MNLEAGLRIGFFLGSLIAPALLEIRWPRRRLSAPKPRRWLSNPGLDRWLRRFILTPDMHRVHHSVLLRECHSNFGFNLAWWDRLFRT